MKTFKFSNLKLVYVLMLILFTYTIHSNACPVTLSFHTYDYRAGANIGISNAGGTVASLITNSSGIAYYTFNSFCDAIHYATVTDIDCAYPPCVHYFYPQNIADVGIDGDCYCETDDKTAPGGLINLFQNYPNPFNPITDISFSISKEMNVKLTIYNTAGVEIQTLVDTYLGSGIHKYSFDGTNVPSGIYFYKLETPDYTSIKKMILVK